MERLEFPKFKEKFHGDPVAVLQEAGSNRMSLSQLSNRQCPEPLIKTRRSVMDMLVEDAGLCTRTSEMTQASSIEEFHDQGKAGQAMLYDILYRSYNGKRRKTRSQLTSGSETPVDSALYPAVVGTPRYSTATAAFFDASELIAIDHEIRGNVYKPFRWNTANNPVGRQRTNPGTDLPKKTLVESETMIQLYKYGVAFELTYEALKNMNPQIDKLADMIALDGEAERVRELTDVIKVLRDGDGTAGSAVAAVKANALDSSINTTGQVTADAFLGFVDSFLPYGVTHMVMRSSVRRKLLLAHTGSPNFPLARLIDINAPGIPGMSVINGNQGIRLGAVQDSDIADNYILGLNANRALEKVREAGSSVQQQAENILNQTNLYTLSDTENYAKLDFFATRALDLTT